MAIFRVVVVAWPVEVGGHQADRIKAVLLAQRVAELDPSDFGNGIPFIGRLKLASERGLLFDRLLRELRVYAAAAQEQQTLHSARPSQSHGSGS